MASRQEEDAAAARFLTTTLWIYSLATLVAITILIIFHRPIFSLMFSSSVPFHSSLVAWLAVPLLLNVAQTYVGGVVNAKRDITWLAVTQVLGAAAGAILSFPLARLVAMGYWQTFIVFLSLTNGLMLGLYLYKCIPKGWLHFTRHLTWPAATADAKKFLLFSLGIFGAGLVSNLTLLILRSLLIHSGGPEEVGFFQASWGISMNYIMVILASMGTYYLPTLSGSAQQDQGVVVRNVLLLVTLVAMLVVTMMILLKPLLIRILFTRDFFPTLKLLRWMLIGDYLKAISWCRDWCFWLTAMSGSFSSRK